MGVALRASWSVLRSVPVWRAASPDFLACHGLYCLWRPLSQDSPVDQKVTWAQIKTALAPVIKKVVDGKFHEPRASDDEIAAYYNAIADEVNTAFQHFTDAL